MRIIPKTAKVKIQFFKNISIADTIIAIIALGVELLLFLTNLGVVKYLLMVVLFSLVVGLYLPFDGQRFYMMFVHLTRYIFTAKCYRSDYKNASTSMDRFIPFKDIKDGYIVYEDYFAGVLQIDPREFRLLSGYRQDQIIDVYFGRLIRSISGKMRASLVKVDRKLVLSDYITAEKKKRDQLEKLYAMGSITQEELSARLKVIADRIAVYNNLSGEKAIKKPFYYLVVYDADKSAIREVLQNGITSLSEAGMTSEILNDKQLAVF